MRILVVSTPIFKLPCAGYSGLEHLAWLTAKGLAEANDNIGPLTNAFGNLLKVGAPFIEQMGYGFAFMTGEFSSFINEAAQTGQLTGWLNAALSVMGSIS